MRAGRITAGIGALVAALGLVACGSSGGAASTGHGPTPSGSGWPTHLDNAKVAALYNTANESSQVVDCASAASQQQLGVDPNDSHIQGGGGSDGGPEAGELVQCTFGTPYAGTTVTLGPSGASTWASVPNASTLHPGSVINGSGTLNLPYTHPVGWQWRLSYGYAGVSPGVALALAHAVADELAAH